MTTPISVEEIKRDLPAYLLRVESGETLVLLKGGKPVAEIKPIASASKAPTSLRPFGLNAGEFVVPEDFDQPLPKAILAQFEGR